VLFKVDNNDSATLQSNQVNLPNQCGCTQSKLPSIPLQLSAYLTLHFDVSDGSHILAQEPFQGACSIVDGKGSPCTKHSVSDGSALLLDATKCTTQKCFIKTWCQGAVNHVAHNQNTYPLEFPTYWGSKAPLSKTHDKGVCNHDNIDRERK
jgi:hypothetical protein